MTRRRYIVAPPEGPAGPAIMIALLIIAAVAIPVEVGGGLRSDGDIRSTLDLSADRAIIGTRALAEPEILKRLVNEFGAELAVGIDARNGMVQVKGWVETSGIRTADLADVVRAGVMHVLCHGLEITFHGR